VTEASAIAEAVRAFLDSQPHRALRAVALQVDTSGAMPVVRGQVLTARQAREVRDLARVHGAGLDLRVAADPGSGLEQGWVAPTVEVLNVWRDPTRAGEEMGRQNQYLRSDGPLRRFGEDGAFILVQGRDLAMGWAAAAELEAVGAADAGASWDGIARAVEGESRPPDRGEANKAVLLARARTELDVPYVWGGTTHAGFDCSGLLMRVLFDTTGVLLPRHTGDQRRVGARVPDDPRAGDLLFAAPLSQKVGHVLLLTSPSTVLHACRTEHRVIEEDLAANAQRYRHQGYRRPVLLPE
jgi:cell wall-associated NlpC family hydrolase